ncbi:unnamed protein product [Heterotrigona itama]|uniref:Odorant receptor n=1 Tax=Heterotrigona itama TaxID=395501 RepID=A0A6V7GX85_9HYME|nr:unnamed protein product [Heterotrigona itama]
MQTVQHSDLSINLSTFFLKNIGLWIPEDSMEERRMKMMLFFTVFNSMIGAVVIFRDLYFTLLYKGVSIVQLNNDVLYVITNVLTVVMGLIKMYTILMHKSEFINLIIYMQQNFWIVNYDFREKEILDNCRKTCTFFISSVTTIGVCAMLSYTITPIIDIFRKKTIRTFVAANVGKNQSERVLPFNLWINLPLYISPYYEILFFFQNWLILTVDLIRYNKGNNNLYLVQVMNLYYVAITYFCFDNIFCILVVHLAGQFRVLRYRFTKLCNLEHKIREATLIDVYEFYEKLKMYIRHHQTLINYYKRLETVYTMIIFGQVLVFSVLICLFAYQGLLVGIYTLSWNPIIIEILLNTSEYLD